LPQEATPSWWYAIDRIGRNARSVIELVEELEKRKVSLVSIREGVDLSTAVGKMMLGMVAASQMELKLILKERTKAGMAAAAAGRRRTTDQTDAGERRAVIMRAQE
jgi:DNA invertase Pin-like site-specific DNA recombinase